MFETDSEILFFAPVRHRDGRVANCGIEARIPQLQA